MNELEAIRQNKRTVQQRRQTLENELAHRQSELSEMRTALAALDRLNGQTPQSYMPQAMKDTVPKRIITYLRQHGPCTSYKIADGLAAEWRTDLTFATVSTTLSRLRGRGAVDRCASGEWIVK